MPLNSPALGWGTGSEVKAHGTLHLGADRARHAVATNQDHFSPQGSTCLLQPDEPEITRAYAGVVPRQRKPAPIKLTVQVESRTSAATAIAKKDVMTLRHRVALQSC